MDDGTPDDGPEDEAAPGPADGPEDEAAPGPANGPDDIPAPGPADGPEDEPQGGPRPIPSAIRRLLGSDAAGGVPPRLLAHSTPAHIPGLVGSSTVCSQRTCSHPDTPSLFTSTAAPSTCASPIASAYPRCSHDPVCDGLLTVCVTVVAGNKSAAQYADDFGEARGFFRTRTRPTLNLLLIIRVLRASVSAQHLGPGSFSDRIRVLVLNDPPARQ
jgi:hypothetical protein